ncbi:pentatricopeptide repeat-containing protein At1g28690, mitochondrial-like [Asparagus officinalis]|uniref:pentatricopeptide repeat-containing protein At1g28690, mitochondrial-like n=1 Tax=Asparagus officinalis TaxID=4686 RepID=UPI00098E5FA2|nr:pentatricopeptide repeat-containing protein At1g28690, mitochondrial-like [Asparagus officinalis]
MAFSPTSNPLIVSVSSSISSRNNPKPISLKLPKTKLMPVSSSEFSTLLQSCIDSRSLTQGKELHSQIKQAGFEKNRDLLPKLIKLYSVCGRIDNARELFDRIPKRNLDTFIWTSLISGYTRNGNPSGSFDIFSKMLEHGAEPDGYTFSVLLRASAELGFLKLTGDLYSVKKLYQCVTDFGDIIGLEANKDKSTIFFGGVDESGGLGVFYALVWNLAAALKNLWHIHVNRELMWIKWIHGTYLKQRDVWHVKARSRDSWM